MLFLQKSWKLAVSSGSWIFGVRMFLEVPGLLSPSPWVSESIFTLTGKFPVPDLSSYGPIGFIPWDPWLAVFSPLDLSSGRHLPEVKDQRKEGDLGWRPSSFLLCLCPWVIGVLLGVFALQTDARASVAHPHFPVPSALLVLTISSLDISVFLAAALCVTPSLKYFYLKHLCWVSSHSPIIFLEFVSFP